MDASSDAVAAALTADLKASELDSQLEAVWVGSTAVMMDVM